MRSTQQEDSVSCVGSGGVLADAPALTREEEIDRLRRTIAELEGRLNGLRQEGVIWAREHWRKRGPSRYLILVYPMRDGVRPSPTYIGCKEERIRAALDGIRRAAVHDQITRKLAERRRELERYLVGAD